MITGVEKFIVVRNMQHDSEVSIAELLAYVKILLGIS